ncbi:MAG: SPOR domain-containing protein [Tsuneonella sp.]
MIRTANRNPMIALAAGTALAALALAGCAATVAPPASASAAEAQTMLAHGKADKAVESAEAAVLAQPRNAAFRAVLGAAYLEAGRFESAATSFDDAMKLGDQTSRTALSYALAKSAAGDSRAALAVLEDWRDDIPASDLGLAMALAGRPDQGVQILSNALRGGENTPKVRQNLAYAYALMGDWSSARIMAAEDVPADKLGERLGQWAATARPDLAQARVATLLGVPQVADSGQPAQLALVNNPSVEQLASEAAAQASQPQVAQGGELPALGAPANTQVAAAESLPVSAPVAAPPAQPVADSFAQAFAEAAPTGATPAQRVENAARFVANPVVQAIPASYEAPAPRPRRVTGQVAGTIATPAAATHHTAAAAPAPSGDHLVQLGSFSSEQGARRAWGIYVSRYPELARYDMVITQAVVRGKNYWRVSAGGFARADASSMCGRVKSGGNGCIAWAEGSPLPGAVDRGVRMASR